MSSVKTILVTGATGRQGGAVLQHLQKRNFLIKALSRTPDSIQAQQLISEEIEVVKGDMGDTDSLVRAMEGCDGVFSIQNYFEYGAAKEVLYGKNMADAAAKTRVNHFIYNSVCNADDNTGVPHFESKDTVEKYIKSIGLPATIIRPVKFMENYYITQVFKGILSGKLFDPIHAGKRHQMISVNDVGAFVAEAFCYPDNFLGQTISIAGDTRTNEEVTDDLSQVLGRKIKFKRLPLLIAKLAMDREMFLMFKWFNEKGFTADMDRMHKIFPAVPTTTLKQWLLDEGWQRWNKKGTV